MEEKKIIGYLRVSTVDQDTEKNKADLLNFCNRMGFIGRVNFVEEKVSGTVSWKKRKLGEVIEKLNDGDILVVPELSRLGRSLIDILEILNNLTQKGVKVYSVKENFCLNGQDIQSKTMRTLLGLFAEIERDLISMRTKEGLKAVREKGVKLGRPKGSRSSKLDKHEKKIIEWLKLGVPKKLIAKKLKVHPQTLYSWLRYRNYDKIKPEL